MSKNYRSINIFVSHPFEPQNPIYDIEKFRTNIKLLISQAENVVRKEYDNDFEIETTYVFNDSFAGLPQQIEKNIRNCHIGIVDITESKPNIFFEYGLLYGLNIPILLIKTKESMTTFPIPADINDKLPILYDTFDNLLDNVVKNLADEFKKILLNNSLANIYLNQIWFNNTGNINVIAPPESEKSEYASPESKNYIFLNNVGDIDTVLEIMNFLNRNYRGIKIDIFSADEFKKNIEDNLVVIGGPGDSEDDGNSICALMMDKMDVKINYSFSEEDETLDYKNQKFSAVYRNDKVVKDYGYFARFPNPFNPKSSVILIHGIHTFGVLGAAKAFSDHPSAQGNIRKVMKKLNLDDIKQASFECFFPVDVLQQSVVCPEIDEDYILPLTKKS